MCAHPWTTPLSALDESTTRHARHVAGPSQSRHISFGISQRTSEDGLSRARFAIGLLDEQTPWLDMRRRSTGTKAARVAAAVVVTGTLDDFVTTTTVVMGLVLVVTAKDPISLMNPTLLSLCARTMRHSH